MKPPTISDVLAARNRIAPFISPTPLRSYPSVDKLLGAQVLVKHENHLPTGAFKVRGGVNLVAQLSDDERSRGVIAASTGNHGQSVAYAARLFDVNATICVPMRSNPVKMESMTSLGATLEVFGNDYDDAREHCEQIASKTGMRYIHSGDEPALVAGVGTSTLEILEREPDVDVIFVPVGGGSGACGACITAKSLRPSIQVIGVQSEAAPAAYLSWKSRSLVNSKNETAAEGLSTRTPFALPQKIMWDLLDDFLLVSEAELTSSTARLIELTRNLVEPAGAAAFAGALSVQSNIEGQKVVIIMSGGNISPAQLRQILSNAD